MPLKQSTVQMSHIYIHAGIKLSPNYILFHCRQVKLLFRNSDLFPNSTINTFPTDVLYNPQYLVSLAHLFLKSPIGPVILIVYECNVRYVSAYAYSCVCCSRANNYSILIKHDYYLYMHIRVYVVVGLIIIVSLSNMITILRSV